MLHWIASNPPTHKACTAHRPSPHRGTGWSWLRGRSRGREEWVSNNMCSKVSWVCWLQAGRAGGRLLALRPSHHNAARPFSPMCTPMVLSPVKP